MSADKEILEKRKKGIVKHIGKGAISKSCYSFFFCFSQMLPTRHTQMALKRTTKTITPVHSTHFLASFSIISHLF